MDFTPDLAMGQIPRSTERIASYSKCLKCLSFSFPQALSLFCHSSTVSSTILRESPFHVSVKRCFRSVTSRTGIINTILHNTSYCTGLDYLEAHKFGTMNFGVSLKELDGLTHTMRWCTVYLEYVSVTSNTRGQSNLTKAASYTRSQTQAVFLR